MAKNSANAVSYRRSLLLSTAILTLITAGTQPVSAQSVSGTGLDQSPIDSPDWKVGGDGSGSLHVGFSGGTGTLSITGGGKVTDHQGFIGRSGGTGTVTVSGGADNSGTTASTWYNDSNLSVGLNGTGTLIINGGGQVISQQGDVGLVQSPPTAPAIGTVTVSGSDGAGHASTWWNSSLFLGNGGSGTLKIEDGGAVVTNGIGHIGYQAGGDGTVTVSGTDGTNASTWSLGSTLYVGQVAKGTLNILDGGKVSNTDGYIGASSADSTATVDGHGSTWTNTGFLRVGDQGTNAQLNITGGGTVTNATGYIGYGPLGDGTVTVSGSDGTNASTWINNGDLVVGQAGKGTLKVLDGGVVTNADGYIGAESSSVGAQSPSTVLARSGPTPASSVLAIRAPTRSSTSQGAAR